MSLISINIKQAGYEKDEAMIQDIQFSVEKGELIGLIGANGAGKSTTIKSILGLIPFIEGEIIKKEETITSYLPERPVFYDDLTLQEHIDFIAAVEQITDEEVTDRVMPLLKKFKMAEHIHELPATYSKGMQQKAMIILALMTQPEILIIDEPFIGLDPIATKTLLEIIQKERDRGVGILMCTHVLDTAEKICDRFVLINAGHLIANGKLEEFRTSCKMPEASLFDCYHHLIDGDSDE
ncbi:ABC transporter ATP-binding protein [Bacillus sp. CGMCC 1.16607]|uniref:ABC transporter ATP-binding protein n=1 Tax=Bacillus sp. CGMCC 1.16607 TaxID=3351842 RepID=UPI00364502F1